VLLSAVEKASCSWAGLRPKPLYVQPDDSSCCVGTTSRRQSYRHFSTGRCTEPSLSVVIRIRTELQPQKSAQVIIAGNYGCQIQKFTMTWIKDDNRSWYQKFCMNVLKQGPVPSHVGIIMDGNRRYAKHLCVSTIEGHKKGFETLADTLRWCWEFGVTELTAYVFSIENFKRSKEEVDGLMALAKEKFEKLLNEHERLNEEGVCVQIIGDWTLVPDDLKPLFAKVMVLTRHNSRARLNVAFAYTSRNEITRGIRTIHEGIADNLLLPEDVSEDFLTDTFRMLPSKPLDLLVRTSGETRLSDFLLWQSSETVLCFTDVLWPEFTIWNLMAAVFYYQINIMSIKKLQLRDYKNTHTASQMSRQQDYLSLIAENFWKQMEIEAAVLG